MAEKNFEIINYAPAPAREFVYQRLLDVDARKGKEFLFSIVMAVYNASAYLDQTIQSVLHQDIGFHEHIQLILVDDGSTDNSLEICAKYGAQHPENIVVVHKENGGVSSARNAGLEFVTGRYINFLDSDDYFGLNVCTKVADFFKKNGSFTDIVAIRVELVGAKSGRPGLFDKKYEKGDRVINLWKEPEIYQNSTNNCFISSALMNWLHFDEELNISEDLKLVNTLLMHKYSIGILASCSYYYRITNDDTSLVHGAQRNPVWYFPYLERVAGFLMDTYKTKTGFIPGYIQYTLLRDLYNRFNNNKDFETVITDPEQKRRYKETLFGLLSRIDDSVILRNGFLNSNWQVYFLSIKHGAPKLNCKQAEGKITYAFSGGASVTQTMFQTFSFAKIIGDKLILEGYVPLPNWHGLQEVQIKVSCGNDRVSGGVDEGPRFDNLAFGDEYTLFRHYYRVEIDHLNSDSQPIEITLLVNGYPLSIPLVGYGEWFPLTKKLPDPYYCVDGLCLSTWGVKLVLSRLSLTEWKQREEKTWAFLASSKDRDAAKGLAYRKAYFESRTGKKRKPIWIVSDRHVCGGDNGEAFYRYLLKHKSKEIDAYFALDESSEDFARLKREGFRMLDMTSQEYCDTFVLADVILSSYFDHSEIKPINNEFIRSLITDKKYVFLQHGITKDDVSFYYTRQTMNFSMVVTACPRERDSFVETRNYLLRPEGVALTGFPRYDLLENQPGKVLLVMPTWRNKMVQFGINGLEPQVNPAFVKSSYFRFYHDLLSSEKLHALCRKYGYKISYFPHNNMMPTDVYFKDIEDIEIVEEDRVYATAFAKASVMVTDFSSTAFDFAYLRKPVVYCQGDAEEFFLSHTYRRGYFSYEKDGFGPIFSEVDEVVDYLAKLFENDCRMEPEYLDRTNAFFAFDDNDNSARVYEAVRKLK